MKPFNIASGPAAPFLAANIDTDVIMPKQFLTGIDRNGLADGVFYDQRFLGVGKPNPKFILNRPEWQSSKFLVVGPNFGCGSSREHAVWGLKQIGINAIIGTSFGGIFYDNCLRNGLLAITLDERQLSRLGERVAQPTSNTITVNLPEQSIILDNGEHIAFDFDALIKDNIIKGLDEVGKTLQSSEEIRSFETDYLEQNPWLKS